MTEECSTPPVDSVTCRRCGLTSTLRDQFRRGLCPFCQSQRHVRGHGLAVNCVRLGRATVLFAACLHFAVEIHFSAIVGVVLALLVARLLFLPLHEACHFLAARLCGWAVTAVRIWSGEPWITFRTGRTRWSVGGALGGGGNCTVAPDLAKVTWRACACVLLAPNAIQLAIAIGVVPFFGNTLLGGAAVGTTLELLSLSVLSLTPRRISTPAGVQLSDGGHLRRLVREPAAELALWRLHALHARIGELLGSGGSKEALAVLRKEAAQLPEHSLVMGYVAAVHAACGETDRVLHHVRDYARLLEYAHDADNPALGGFTGDDVVAYQRGSLLVALDRLDEVLDLAICQRNAATSEDTRARWSACVALALLLRRQDEESVRRAAEAAAYAHARLPWVNYVMTAQGMALIELGEHAKGLHLFELGDTRDPDRSGMRDAWRVVAHTALGQPKSVAAAMRRLREGTPWPACLRRAEGAAP